MPAQPIMSAEEWFAAMKGATPATDDDVTVLADGRRIDCRDAVLQWLDELQAERTTDAASTDALA